jgi:disease resistance protein RPS2
LLLESNVQGCVKMHDIVRKVVISLLFKNEEDKFMVQYNFKEEKLNDIKAISLILDDTNKLESGLECPTLKLLQVKVKKQGTNLLVRTFLPRNVCIKVLSMQNSCIPKLPSLSQASFNLHTLKVEHCDVGDISINGKKLVLLKVLGLAHSNIKELPIEIGDLGSLRLLDLTDCNDLNFISDIVLIRLFRLEELYFRMANFPWNKNEVAINELKKISHQLKVVEMKFRGTEILVKDLVFNNLQKFWVYVDRYSNFQRSSYLESNLLHVSSIGYQYINSILMISQVIKKCEILAIKKVKDLKNIISHLVLNSILERFKGRFMP